MNPIQSRITFDTQLKLALLLVIFTIRSHRNTESMVDIFVVTGDATLYTALLNAWCPEYGQVKVYLTDTGEEAILLQEWLRLRMIRSQVSRVVDAGKTVSSYRKPNSHDRAALTSPEPDVSSKKKKKERKKERKKGRREGGEGGRKNQIHL